MAVGGNDVLQALALVFTSAIKGMLDRFCIEVCEVSTTRRDKIFKAQLGSLTDLKNAYFIQFRLAVE
jgi:hypothetical protein